MLRKRNLIFEAILIVSVSGALALSGGIATALASSAGKSKPVVGCVTAPEIQHSEMGQTNASEGKPDASCTAPVTKFKLWVKVPSEAKQGSTVIIRSSFENEGTSGAYAFRTLVLNDQDQVVATSRDEQHMVGKKGIFTQSLKLKTNQLFRGTYTVRQQVVAADSTVVASEDHEAAVLLK